MLVVLKQFEFESKFQRMSVVVRDQERFFVFSKGAPEKIAQMVQRVPNNFKSTLDQLTMRGLRVLGLAFRELDSYRQLSRVEAEQEMEFAGFLILENKLKDDTPAIID